MDQSQPDEIPSVTISGAPVLLYGDAPLSNVPADLDSGSLLRESIKLDSIDWSPIPPGYPEDSMELTLPTFNLYRPDLPPSTEPMPPAFAYSSGCFVVDASPTKSEGIAKSLYSLQWGDSEAQPVLSSNVSDTIVAWLYMDGVGQGDSIAAIRPPTNETREGFSLHEFPYSEVFQADVLVVAPRLQVFVTIAYWAAGVLGTLCVAGLFQFLFRKRESKPAPSRTGKK
jgi:hypothetical protein